MEFNLHSQVKQPGGGVTGDRITEFLLYFQSRLGTCIFPNFVGRNVEYGSVGKK